LAAVATIATAGSGTSENGSVNGSSDKANGGGGGGEGGVRVHLEDVEGALKRTLKRQGAALGTPQVKKHETKKNKNKMVASANIGLGDRLQIEGYPLPSSRQRRV
jgi:hypothetical protein